MNTREHTRDRRAGRRWIAGVIGLVCANITICAVTVASARSSAVPIEKNYDAKALKWDDSAGQRAANRSLGWRMNADTDRTSDGAAQLNVRLLDSSGRPIRIARVLATIAAADAAATDRATIELTSSEGGLYTGTLPAGARGWWDVQVAADAGGMRFCEQTRVLVSPALAHNTSHAGGAQP